MGTYKNKRTLEWTQGRVCIYQLSRTESKNYYVRIRRNVGEGYFRQSLKTENPAFAEKMANDLWLKVLVSEELNVPFGKNGFNTIFKRFLKEGGISSEGRLARVRDTWKLYFGDYFGEMEIGRINNRIWRRYCEWRRDYWTNREKSGASLPTTYKKVPSYATYHTERQILKQFLNYAVKFDYLHKVPLLDLPEKIEFIRKEMKTKGIAEKQQGTAVPYEQLQAIRKVLYNYAFKTKDNQPSRELARKRLWAFCHLCFHSMLRPTTEMTTLTFSCITIEQSRNHEDAFIGIIKTKHGKWKSTMNAQSDRERTAILSYAGIKFLLQWKAELKKLGYSTGEDDYVFPSWEKGRHAESHLMGRSFQLLLKNHKMRKWDGKKLNNKNGTNITIYSWRHSAITSMIVEGKKDIGTVSKQSDTSILQLSRTYFNAWLTQGNKDKWANRFAEGEKVRTPKAPKGFETMEDALRKNGFKIKKV